jgi:hypothetical protein
VPTAERAAPTTDTTFYTVSDARFFPGVVALINSLRLTGNTGQVVVADLGLTADQRERLGAVATVVSLTEESRTNPLLYKAFPHAFSPSGRVVIIDSDILVTANLDPMLRAVDRGRLVLFEDRTQPHRWFAQWLQLFALRAPLRSGPYLNSGVLAFDQEQWPHLLDRWWHLCQGIPSASTRAGGAPWESPTCDGDQDALNALLLSEIPAGVVELRTQDVASVMNEVRVLDPSSLRCLRADGQPVEVLHHTGSPKPWQDGAYLRVRRNAYVRLLPRVLLGDDVALRLGTRDLPRWLWPDHRGRALLALLDVGNGLAQAAVHRAPDAPREALRHLRMRLAGGLRPADT